GEYDDIDTKMRGRGMFGHSASRLESVDAAKRPVEPARMVLALQMGSRQHFGAARTASPENVGDAVNLGVEPGLPHAQDKPLACRNFLRRQRRAMPPGLVGAELRKPAQVGEDTLRLDVRPGHPVRVQELVRRPEAEPHALSLAKRSPRSSRQW